MPAEMTTIADNLLLEIFGNYEGGEITAVSVVIQNVAILAFAAFGLLSAFLTIAGVMKTCHDGEALGKTWNSLWVPFRWAVGAMLICPVPAAAGMPVASMVMIWAVEKSVELADYGADAVIDHIAVAPPIHVDTPTAYREAAKAVLMAQTCAYGIAHQFIVTAPPEKLNPAIDLAVYENMDGSDAHRTTRAVWSWPGDRVDGGLGYTRDLCGRVSYPVDATIIENADAWFSTEQVIATTQTKILNSVGAAHDAAFKTLVDNLRPIAAETVYYHHLEMNSFNAAVENYQQAVRDGVSAAVAHYTPAATEEWRESAKEAGFIAVGSWLWQLSRIQESTARILSGMGVETVPATLAVTGNNDSAAIADAMSRVDHAIHIDRIQRGMSGTPHPQPEAEPDDGLGILSDAAQAISEKLRSNGQMNPIMRLQQIGHGLMAVASGASLVGVLSPFVAAVAFVLWSTAVTFSYVIPAIPYVMWVMAIVGWLILVIEAAVLAPIWAVLFAHPEGGEVTGMGAQGIVQMFLLLVRPVLMLTGMVLGLSLFLAAASWIDQTMWTALSVDGSSTSSSILGIIGSLVVYATVIIAVARLCFGLVSSLPSAIGRWISAAVSDGAGDSAHRAEAGLSRAGAAGAQVGNAPIKHRAPRSKPSA